MSESTKHPLEILLEDVSLENIEEDVMMLKQKMLERDKDYTWEFPEEY